MVIDEGRVNILIVDDKPEKLVALEALLEDLQQNVVCASSGREALRQILRQEFAVILLDINMPAMDGFETATLIRQHRSFRMTPIIFLTALGDEVYFEKSYSLGAVDYIPTLAVPDVLRTKVAVFVELAKKTAQVQRQAESLRRQAAQLRDLTRASLQINSALSLDAMLRAITDAARDIVGAHLAVTSTMLGQPPGKVRSATSVSDTYAAHRSYAPSTPESGLLGFACACSGSIRVAASDLPHHVEWRKAQEQAEAMPPMRGWLSAPLTEVTGTNMGAIQLSDKRAGDFTEDDEAILVQLAQLASIAIQNCLHAEAREANRLKDEFLATLSHELRTPLHAILGWTGLLRSGGLDPAQVPRALEVIERNACAQKKLIEELLDVSRIVSGKFAIQKQRLLFSSVVEAAADSLRPLASSKPIGLKVSIDAQDLEVEGDPDRLQQVARNLLSNAIKFTPAGGEVRLSVEPEGGAIELRVEDTGDGIDPDFLPFVFDRFRQGDSSSRRSQAGLGIGLAVVRHIVDLHGGSVRAESRGKGQGSTFFVRLPAARRRARERATPAPLGLNGKGLRGLRVLLVDDDEDSREVLGTLLRMHEVEVTAVGSVAEALEALEKALPDLLVSDIAMPGADGYELIRRVRQRAPDAGGAVPALALTAYAREEDHALAVRAGFQTHAAKPIAPEAFVEIIASLTGRSAPTEPPANA